MCKAGNGKLHDNVIQKIERLECSIEFNRLNFELIDYADQKGEPRKMYTLTRDGFSFLVNKLKGKRAAEFTENFIAAFNAMEEELMKPKGQYEIPKTYSEALMLSGRKS